MRLSIDTFLLTAGAVSVAFSGWGCSGEVKEAPPEKELQVRDDGEPTGDGSTCSWSGTSMQMNSRCGETSVPAGYGPYSVGEDFASPDGCNECTCTAKGIMCTVLDCTADGQGQGPDADRAAPAPEESCTVACTKDAKICPDGSAVGRTGPNCEFEACPEEGTFCTDDAMMCPDGSWVGRSGPSCEFVCEEIACPADTQLCSDGSDVPRTGPDCTFAPCPYDPCENKACGDICSLCPPDDTDCFEDPSLKSCNSEGICSAVAACK